jgi:hypothetical protein
LPGVNGPEARDVEAMLAASGYIVKNDYILTSMVILEQETM